MKCKEHRVILGKIAIIEERRWGGGTLISF